MAHHVTFPPSVAPGLGHLLGEGFQEDLAQHRRGQQHRSAMTTEALQQLLQGGPAWADGMW